jgi:tetratricopeptide (TPR) repeat protein
MPMTRSALRPQVLALALLLVPGLARAMPEGVRPLSEAERQATRLAAEYLEKGPAGWWDHLAAASPLRRLGREAALAEIEVRAGAPAGAEWELEASPEEISGRGAVFTVGFPSGADDALVLGLVQEGGDWKIDSLRISAEPVAEKGGAREGEDATAVAPGPAASPAPPSKLASGLGKLPVWLFAVGGAAGLLLLAAAWTERSHRGLAAGLGVAGGLIAAGALAGAVLPRTLAAEPAIQGGKADAGMAELRSLLPLRRALTEAEGSVPAVAPPQTRQPGVPGQVARLWWAQHLLGGMDLQGVDEVLRDFPSPGRFPLAELLRARASFLRLEEVPTAVAFQRAASVGVPHEALLSEAAQAFLLLGFDNHAKEFLGQLRDLGARQAETWYTLAQVTAGDDKLVDAVHFFDTGWQLQPTSRSEIFGRPLLTALLEDLEVRKLARLGAAEEPAVECEEAASRALPLPAGFSARTLGRTLRLTHDEAELRVPGGCDLAPEGTAGDRAGAWTEERAARLLERLPTLLKAARTPGALAQPSLRKRVEETADALAGERRWAELVSLTESLAGDPSSVPPDLVRLRAEALRRTGREDEARGLLIRLAKGNTAQRRTDPGTLYQLANLLSRQGSFDDAIKLVAKADSQLPFQADGEYLRQLQMEKRLAASSEVYRSPHFAIRYPPARGEKFAAEAARILEAERARLQAWIPVNSPRVIEVHLLPFDDFRTGYSPGMDVLGLYDGRVSVPLGDVGRFNPFVVSILTHELAHAMITERTGDQAPRWLQEGLAQHVEMVQENVNPIAGYRDKENLVAIPVLESAIGSLSPALVAIGYDEARWTLHYVEQRYGKAGIHRLLDAYRTGKSTDEAIQAAFGVTTARFNQDLWTWATTEAPDVWKVELVKYDDQKVTRIVD